MHACVMNNNPEHAHLHKICNACSLIANMHAVEPSFKRCMHNS